MLEILWLTTLKGALITKVQALFSCCCFVRLRSFKVMNQCVGGFQYNTLHGCYNISPIILIIKL